MNMSRSMFYRKIKGLSNLTPYELIKLSRLKKAAELLVEAIYKINEVQTWLATAFTQTLQETFISNSD